VCTPKENIEHKDNVLGKHNRGANSGLAKLTNKDIYSILNLVNNYNITQVEVAQMFNVCKSTICRIKSGKRWGHLELRGLEYGNP